MISVLFACCAGIILTCGCIDHGICDIFIICGTMTKFKSPWADLPVICVWVISANNNNTQLSSLAAFYYHPRFNSFRARCQQSIAPARTLPRNITAYLVLLLLHVNGTMQCPATTPCWWVRPHHCCCCCCQAGLSACVSVVSVSASTSSTRKQLNGEPCYLFGAFGHVATQPSRPHRRPPSSAACCGCCASSTTWKVVGSPAVWDATSSTVAA